MVHDQLFEFIFPYGVKSSIIIHFEQMTFFKELNFYPFYFDLLKGILSFKRFFPSDLEES